MSEALQISLIVIVITVILVVMAVGMAGLMVLNANRRVRHSLELEAAQRRFQEELVRAEREATQETLHHMGRELHDNVGQLLTVSLIGLRNALEGANDPRKLTAVREALEAGIEQVRNMAHSMSPAIWQNRTLADALAAEAARLERVVRITASVRIEGATRNIPPDTATMLYRVFQETVNNVLKHSQADTIRITLRYGPPLALIVSDNGKGFDPDQTNGNGGLHTLRHRCALIGFSAQCESAPGHGCTWTFMEQKPLALSSHSAA